MQGLYHLYFPGFSESNVFDALLETVDRLKRPSRARNPSCYWPRRGHLFQNTRSINHESNCDRVTSQFSAIGLGRAFQNYADMNGGMVAWRA